MKARRFVWVSIYIAMAILFNAPVSAHEENLEKLWEMTEGFKFPESVIYDKDNEVLYVSNIDGSPVEKDGNGYIAKVSLDGKMIKADWITGLHAPKGMAIYNGKLFVSDVDALVEIDIAGAKILNRHQAMDSGFVNDVTVTADGTVYMSDTATQTIYRYNGKLEKWLTSEELDSPNGLFAEKDHLVVGTMGGGFEPEAPPGRLLTVSLVDKTISKLTKERIGLIDGVQADLDGDYYVTSHMAGELLHINQAGEVSTLLKLEPGLADHEYIQQKDMLIMPLLRANKLLAYKAHHGKEQK